MAIGWTDAVFHFDLIYFVLSYFIYEPLYYVILV